MCSLFAAAHASTLPDPSSLKILIFALIHSIEQLRLAWIMAPSCPSNNKSGNKSEKKASSSILASIDTLTDTSNHS